ncbi:899_t:CDS:2, partial [Funneliformis caledonium]
EVVPTQPYPPTHQELGQLDRLMYKLVIANGRSHSARHSPSSYLIEKCVLTVYLGTVTDTELSAGREYSHSLVTTRANASVLAGTNTTTTGAPEWFIQAFSNGGIADQAITNAINNACAPNGAIDQAITNGINNACTKWRHISSYIVKQVWQEPIMATRLATLMNFGNSPIWMSSPSLQPSNVQQARQD